MPVVFNQISAPVVPREGVEAQSTWGICTDGQRQHLGNANAHEVSVPFSGPAPTNPWCVSIAITHCTDNEGMQRILGARACS